MSNFRSDPTAGAAIGAVDREFGLLKKQALKIQELNRQGLLTDEQLAAAERQYVGIYRPLLIKALSGQLEDKKGGKSTSADK